MIPRYSTPAMQRIWSDESRLATWLEVELAVCRAWARRGLINPADLASIEANIRCDPARMAAIEAEVHHDVIAFLTAVSENVGPASRFIHYGLTSSDLLDTAGALQAVRALDIVLASLAALSAVLAEKARAEADTLIIGRTHGMYAEPTTLGLKFGSWFAELDRHQHRLADARTQMAVGKLSGAVGTCAHVDPQMEEEVLAALGLAPEPIASQIVHRDRHAHALTALALLGCSLERFALEIRHLQRSEVAEAAEPFATGQKGSSAMPHKRNPILCERICGLARVLRGNAMVAMENVALWHERDISHSSAERVILPDSFCLADYMLGIMHKVVSALWLDRPRMAARVTESAGQWASQAVLLALIRAGLTREEAYAIVQPVLMKSPSPDQAIDALLADPRVSGRLSRANLEHCFTAAAHQRHARQLLARAGVSPVR